MRFFKGRFTDWNSHLSLYVCIFTHTHTVNNHKKNRLYIQFSRGRITTGYSPMGEILQQNNWRWVSKNKSFLSKTFLCQLISKTLLHYSDAFVGRNSPPKEERTTFFFHAMTSQNGELWSFAKTQSLPAIYYVDWWSFVSKKRNIKTLCLSWWVKN